MEEKYLPIGTVVKLKGGTKTAMIIGFCCQGKENNKIFDYCGCLYPEGMLSSDKNFLFDHTNIEEVLFKGFENEDEKQFKIKLKEALKKMNINN